MGWGMLQGKPLKSARAEGKGALEWVTEIADDPHLPSWGL